MNITITIIVLIAVALFYIFIIKPKKDKKATIKTEKQKQQFINKNEGQSSHNGLQEVQDPVLLYAIAMNAFSEQRYGDTINYLKQASTKGSVQAMNMLGVCHENGYGVPVSYDRAIEYYTPAAESGDKDAQYNLGRLYYIVGNKKYRNYIGSTWMWKMGIEPLVPYEEDALAVKWLKAAALQGNLKAQFGMGELLMGGIGVERSTKNYEEGVNWMKKAAVAGFKPAIDYVEAKKL